LISSPRPNPRARQRRGLHYRQRRRAGKPVLGWSEAEESQGWDRFGSVDLIRLLARRTRSADWSFASAVGPMDYAPRKSRHRFAACTARLSASEQTGHQAQFKSWRGVAAWQRPRSMHHDEHSQNGLAAFRSIVRAGLRAGSGPFAPDLDHLTRQSRRLLLGNRRLSRYVARQSERPQPRGLFTRGQTVCLVFGRCFLTVQQPLLLLLENRFGSIACLMSVQRRYSCSGKSTPQDRPSWGTGCRLPICRCGLG
jgi:hypothetical protein